MERPLASSDAPPVDPAPAVPPVLDDHPHGPVRTGVGGWFITRLPLLVVLAFGTYFAIASYELELGTLRAPLSGLWPFIVSVVLIACTLVGLFTCDPTDVEQFGRPVVRPFLGLAALCLFVLLWDEVGLLLTGAVVLTFWFKVLARESWRMAVALAVGASVVAHLLFVVLLGARLPDDVIAQLWGG
ncbi:UNVERIFIED_ORG: tripartite tricarboxylate transporter TctB family protein [Bacillus sp. AZ43]